MVDSWWELASDNGLSFVKVACRLSGVMEDFVSFVRFQDEVVIFEASEDSC